MNGKLTTKHDASKNYLEFYAKMLLETLIPEKYVNIEPSEKPDLVMGSDYGIEVTWAMFENQGKARSLLTKAAGKKVNELNNGILYSAEKTNIEMLTDENGTVYGITDKTPKNRASNSELLTEYAKKRSKRNGYQTKTTDLFIFPALAQLDGWLGEDEIRGFFNEVEKDSECPFNNIIVFEEPTVYLFNYPSHQYVKVRGKAEQIQQCELAADQYSGYSKRNQ